MSNKDYKSTQQRYIYIFEDNVQNTSLLFFFLRIRPPPRSTLFPHATLFRSEQGPPTQPEPPPEPTPPEKPAAAQARVKQAPAQAVEAAGRALARRAGLTAPSTTPTTGRRKIGRAHV